MRPLRFITVFFILIIFVCSSDAQLKKNLKVTRKAPRYTLTFAIGLNYAVSNVNGDVSSFSMITYPEKGGNTFNADNYGMKQGFGIFAGGKYSVTKKRKLRLTGNLSYNMFYNSRDNGKNRTRWQLISLGAGAEFSGRPSSVNKPFVGCELVYTMMFGAWQTNITYPDGYISNIYVKFKPAHRLGLALTTGFEFKLRKNTAVMLGLRGVWSNILPKLNYYSAASYDSYVNDSQNSNGILLNSSKQVIYIQLLTGINIHFNR